jgi:hypothetical protein
MKIYERLIREKDCLFTQKKKNPFVKYVQWFHLCIHMYWTNNFIQNTSKHSCVNLQHMPYYHGMKNAS